jgi:hypothetical protein
MSNESLLQHYECRHKKSNSYPNSKIVAEWKAIVASKLLGTRRKCPFTLGFCVLNFSITECPIFLTSITGRHDDSFGDTPKSKKLAYKTPE